ncbi:MAG TPA: hypothetical protein VK455_05850 [Thermoplasmata archaeon]|nr:hypothetical protein [Thermoplasmata archaeon]
MAIIDAVRAKLTGITHLAAGGGLLGGGGGVLSAQAGVLTARLQSLQSGGLSAVVQTAGLRLQQPGTLLSNLGGGSSPTPPAPAPPATPPAATDFRGSQTSPQVSGAARFTDARARYQPPPSAARYT